MSDHDAAELVLDSLMLDLTNGDGTLLASSSAAAERILKALADAGWHLYRPDDCETGIMDPVSGYIPVRYDRLWQVVDLKDNPTGKTIYALVPLAEEATQ